MMVVPGKTSSRCVNDPYMKTHEFTEKHTLFSFSFFFPQLLGYNSDLFSNLSEASGRPGGVAAVAVAVRMAERRSEVNRALAEIARVAAEKVPDIRTHGIAGYGPLEF